MKNVNFRKLLLRTLIFALIGSATIGIFIFLFGGTSETVFKLLFTTLFIGGFCLTGLCCSTVYDRAKLRAVSIGGMTISLLALILSILGVWIFNSYESFWQLTIVFLILAIAMAHVSLLMNISPKTSSVKIIRKLTIVIISIVALMLVILAIGKFSMGEFYFRLLGVFAILDVLGTIGTVLANRVAAR